VVQEEGGDLQGHAAAGETPVGVGRVEPVGVHDRHRGREGAAHAVMVGHDHIDARRGGGGHLGLAGGSGVHRDHQRPAFPPGQLDGSVGQAMAVADPVGHVTGHVEAQAAQSIDQDRQARQPVSVEVADDQDSLLLASGSGYPGHDGLGVGQATRVVKASRGRTKVGRQLDEWNPTASKDAAQERRAAVSGNSGRVGAVWCQAGRVSPAVARGEHTRRIACLAHRRLHRWRGAGRARALRRGRASTADSPTGALVGRGPTPPRR
jgi:hypothetical protein